MKRITLLLVLVGAAGCAFSRDWPDEPGNVTALFGRPTDGHFVRGVEFKGSDQRVRAWADGELVWENGADSISVVPNPPQIVLQHESGFRTIYADIDRRPDISNKIEGGDWIGYAGNETWTFQIADSQRKRIIDPLALLPTRINRLDELDYRVFLIRDSQVVELSDGMTVAPGLWNLAISGGNFGEVSLFWLGQSVSSMRFESLAEEDGHVVLETPSPVRYEQVYDNERRLLLPKLNLSVGQGSLEIRLKDESDRINTRIWRVIVRNG